MTVLPSVECLFRAGKPVPAAHPGVRAIACAAGGLSVGRPAEPSLHEQANRIAALFGTQPLIGDDATPAGALEALGTSRYLQLAAHGRQDVDAPLFARTYLAGGVLHAYHILEQDLRGTELVTLSACESTLLRYDFLDNVYGLAPAFLRAGARAVVGALWPVSPDVSRGRLGSRVSLRMMPGSFGFERQRETEEHRGGHVDLRLPGHLRQRLGRHTAQFPPRRTHGVHVLTKRQRHRRRTADTRVPGRARSPTVPGSHATAR